MNSKLVWASLKSFLQSLIATMQTILNAQIMDQIERSGEDVKNDKVRTARGISQGIAIRLWEYEMRLQI